MPRVIKNCYVCRIVNLAMCKSTYGYIEGYKSDFKINVSMKTNLLQSAPIRSRRLFCSALHNVNTEHHLSK